jgi:hypothetical protein
MDVVSNARRALAITPWMLFEWCLGVVDDGWVAFRSEERATESLHGWFQKRGDGCAGWRRAFKNTPWMVFTTAASI